CSKSQEPLNMKVLAIFALLLAYASASALHDLFRLTQDNPNTRITRGHNASPGQFPYQVGLLLKVGQNVFGCGGSLIGHNWILTAAHCTHEYVEKRSIFSIIHRGIFMVKYIVGKNDIITHERFDSSTLRNDIALIRIPHRDYSKDIQAVKLPKVQPRYETYAGQESIATGWGATSDTTNTPPDILQYTALMIMRNNDCAASWREVSPSNICASTTYHASTCRGDSGGPLVELHTRVLIGVTSYGHKKCEIGTPAVFTRVTSFLGWIKHHTGI
ncbi:hypothetical protein KR044_000503, partial [Drosophila immigrans]